MSLLVGKAGCYGKKEAKNKSCFTYSDRNGCGEAETGGRILCGQNGHFNRKV